VKIIRFTGFALGIEALWVATERLAKFLSTPIKERKIMTAVKCYASARKPDLSGAK